MPDANEPLERVAALQAALRMHITLGDLRLHRGVAAADSITAAEAAVVSTADRFWAWLHGPVTLRIFVGQPVLQPDGLSPLSRTEESTVQIHDNEQFPITVVATDAKGFVTTDTLTFASSDDTVCTATVDATDPMTALVVAGNPGSAVVTVSDGTLSATLAVDVVAAGAAVLTINAGAVELQP